jgi:hypothetical protein
MSFRLRFIMTSRRSLSWLQFDHWRQAILYRDRSFRGIARREQLEALRCELSRVVNCRLITSKLKPFGATLIRIGSFRRTCLRRSESAALHNPAGGMRLQWQNVVFAGRAEGAAAESGKRAFAAAIYRPPSAKAPESRAALARGADTSAGTHNVRDHAQKVTSGRLRAGRGGRYRRRTRSQGPDQQSQGLPRALTRVVCCFKADEACLRGLSGLAAQILHPLEHARHEFREFIASRRSDRAGDLDEATIRIADSTATASSIETTRRPLIRLTAVAQKNVAEALAALESTREHFIRPPDETTSLHCSPHALAAVVVHVHYPGLRNRQGEACCWICPDGEQQPLQDC